MKQPFGKRLTMLVAAVCLALTATPAEARDVSLADAIAEALAANTGLRVTAQGEKTAEAELREAKGQNNWSASTSASASTDKQKEEDRTSSGSVGLTFNYPLYTGGKNEANIRSSEYGVDIAGLTTERARETLKYDVIKAYFDALESRHTIDVNQDSVNYYDANLTNVQQLYSAGSKARIDVLRASVELSDARQTLIKSENAYQVNLATLRNLMNIDRTEPLNLTDDFVYDTFDIDLASCVDYATRNRKDILADQYTLQQKEEAVKVAEAGWKPTVNFSAGPSLSKTFEPSMRNESTYDMKAGVSASWDIFDSGVTRAQVDRAKADRDTAQLNLQKAQEDADLSVRTAYYNMREAEHRLDSTQDAVGQAEQDAYIAREKYRAGEGIMLDVIDAQRALSTARLNHISAQYDYARYKAQVIDEMGVGLTDAERTAAAKLAGLPIEKAPAQTITEPAGTAADENTKDTAAHAEQAARDVDTTVNAMSDTDNESASDVAEELAGRGE